MQPSMTIGFDFVTAQIVNVAVAMAISVSMIVVVNTQKTYPGFRRWATASGIYATGMALYLFRGVLPDWLAILVANWLYFSFLPLVNDGLLSFYDVRNAAVWRLVNAAIYGVVCVALTVAFLLHLPVPARVLISAVASLMLATPGMVVLVRQVRRSFSAALLLVITALTILLIAMVGRIVVLLFMPELVPFVGSLSGLGLTTTIVTVVWVAMSHGLFAVNSRRITDELIAASRELARKALTDSLTDLPNRRGFLEQGGKLMALAVRGERPVSVMMIDVDHFKRVNDTYGHLIGDQVLHAVGQAITATLRTSDLAGRMGGEEFGVVMPDTDLGQAEHAAERVRAAIAGVVVGTVTGISASIGIAAREPFETDIADVLRRADDAVYRAKRGGRNRSVAAMP